MALYVMNVRHGEKCEPFRRITRKRRDAAARAWLDFVYSEIAASAGLDTARGVRAMALARQAVESVIHTQRVQLSEVTISRGTIAALSRH